MGTTDGSVEVEVKARVDDLDSVREALVELGATPAGEGHQSDTYFDHPSRSFADTDEALRVRETDEGVELTYKGPKIDEATKTRDELNLGVDDAQGARRLLESLGFQPAGRVAKDRELLELDGLTLALDRVEGLGAFVEIEQVVEEDVDAAREEVLALADELGLDDRERRSYLELLLEE